MCDCSVIQHSVSDDVMYGEGVEDVSAVTSRVAQERHKQIPTLCPATCALLRA